MAEENSDWRTGLPEDLRTKDTFSKFKDVPSLAKSYMELEQHLGKSTVLPGEDAKPEDYDAFFKKWGRPDKFDEYKFPEKLPEGMAIDEKFGGSVKALAHDLGLNKKQFDKLVKWGVEQSVGMSQLKQQQAEEGMKSLKTEWGFSYDNNIEKAHRALALLVNFDDKHPMVKIIDETGLGDNPAFIKFLVELGDRFGEDGLVGDNKNKELEVKVEDAKKKINEMRADQKGPYWNENDPRHNDAIKEMARLYEIAYPKPD